MTSNAFGPEFMLHAGETYNLPKELAKRLLAGRELGNGVRLEYAKPAAPGAKVSTIPPQPDPGDVPDAGIVDDDVPDDGE
jgi:hypothetical protein